MTKYKTRHEYVISRSSDSKSSEDNWLAAIDQNLKKQAVQPRRVDDSLYDQINSIMGGKSKYKSVADAVEEMQRRSGYLDYLSKKANNPNNAKNTSHPDKPLIFLEHPEIEVTINNYVTDTNGHLEVPSILEHIKGIHKNDVRETSHWEDPKLIKHIHTLNEKHQHKNQDDKENSNTLGKIELNVNKDDVDPGNNDAWLGLMPVSK